MSKYNIGDKIRIKEDLEIDKYYGNDVVNSSMNQYLGKTAIVKNIVYNSNGYKYKLDIDSEWWSWTDEMLEGINNNLLDLALELLNISKDELELKFEKEKSKNKNNY